MYIICAKRAHALNNKRNQQVFVDHDLRKKMLAKIVCF